MTGAYSEYPLYEKEITKLVSTPGLADEQQPADARPELER